MKIYFAGDGHKIQDSKLFSRKLADTQSNLLLSFFYLKDNARISTERFEWIKKENERLRRQNE